MLAYHGLARPGEAWHVWASQRVGRDGVARGVTTILLREPDMGLLTQTELTTEPGGSA
jgi:hypothetical protein